MADSVNGSSEMIEEKGGDPKREEERTLTDHLNKKLLESFKQRLADGTIPLQQEQNINNDNDDNSFD